MRPVAINSRTVDATIGSLSARRLPFPTVTPAPTPPIKEQVDAALATFLQGQRAELTDVGADLGSVSTSVERFLLVGGKRVRPLFCYWGARGAGMADSAELVTAASCP